MIEVHQNKTLYVIDNQILGEIDYPSINNNTVNITHTFVDSSLRGQGLADKMMQEVFKFLKESDKKAICTCSYAISWIEKHPEYQKLIVKIH